MNRKGFIGGSDCVKIMQGQWLELWQVKTGRSEPDDLSDNVAVQLGIWTENFNLRWFEKQHDAVVRNHQMEFEKQIGIVPVKGTIDGRVDGYVIEAKHTGAHRNMDDILDLYMPQVQLYCHLAEADGAWLSVIFGNNKWEASFIRYDNQYFDSMWAVVSDFWGYVVRDEEPLGIDVPSFSIDSIEINDMVARDASADNAFIDAAVTFVNGYEQNRVFENAKKDLKAMVADNEREVYCDYLTIKRDKRGALRITRRT